MPWADLLAVYQRAAGGETIDLATLPDVICSNGDAQRQRILCHLIIALRQNQRSPVEDRLLHSVVTMHGSRLVAYALSAYCDRYDLPIGAGLAGSWALLRPDDPLAKHLAGGPSGKRPLMPVEELQKLLAKHAPIDLVWDDVELYDAVPGPFMNRATPWMVAAVCGQLVESGQHDLARELSLRYRHIISRMERTFYQQVYANHLVYAVAQRANKGGR